MPGIGKEILFSLNDFQQPDSITDLEAIGQMLLNLFFMRPGNLPSMPHIGINLPQYLYKLEGDFQPDDIKKQIYEQCADLMPYISLGEVKIFTAFYNEQDVLIVSVPVVGVDTTILIGLSKAANNTIDTNMQFQKTAQSV